MVRRQFFTRGILGLVTLVMVGLGFRRKKADPRPAPRSKAAPRLAPSSNDRVAFVCRDDHGDYSPGVYLHGPDGGGPACLEFASEAAHFMKAGEVGDSAAGLCGYLVSQFGPGVTSGGGISLWDAPRPGPDREVDWQAYCKANVDLILINVDRMTAECFVSPVDPKATIKARVGQIAHLKFGG